MTTSAPSAKDRLRRQALDRRARSPDGTPSDIGARLRDNFLGEFDLSAGTNVAGYWPLPGEMDPRPLMTGLYDAGCRLALPVVAGPGYPLEFRAWAPGDDLVDAAFGLREPQPRAAARIPAVVLVPLVAFDAAGNRLGHGKGYYDLTLGSLRETTAGSSLLAVGIAFSHQQLDAIPYERHDQRLDWIVTENEVIRIGPGS